MAKYTIWASDRPDFQELTLAEGTNPPECSNGTKLPGCDRAVKVFEAKSWRSAQGVFTKFKRLSEEQHQLK